MSRREQLTRRSYETVADDCGLRPEQVAQLIRYLTALPASLEEDRAGTLADLATVIGCTADQVDHVARALLP